MVEANRILTVPAIVGPNWEDIVVGINLDQSAQLLPRIGELQVVKRNAIKICSSFFGALPIIDPRGFNELPQPHESADRGIH